MHYPGDTDAVARNLKRGHNEDHKIHMHTRTGREMTGKGKLLVAHKTGACSVNVFIKCLIQA